MEKSNVKSGIGFDHLPDTIKNSKMLTHDQLNLLAGVNEIPMINPAFEDERLKSIVEYFSTDPRRNGERITPLCSNPSR